jgi:hypothetical protein
VRQKNLTLMAAVAMAVPCSCGPIPQASNAPKPMMVPTGQDVVPTELIAEEKLVGDMKVGESGYVGTIWVDDERHAYLWCHQRVDQNSIAPAFIERRNDGFHVKILTALAWPKISRKDPACDIRSVEVAR